MKSLLRLLALAAALVAAQTASAQVTLTFTATANSTQWGYTLDQPYTFVFTVTSDFVNGSGQSNFDGFSSTWVEHVGSVGGGTPVDSQLFTSITGTGVTGTFVQPPSSTASDPGYIQPDTSGPQSQIYADQGPSFAGSPSDLQLTASANGGAYTGLKSLDNTKNIGVFVGFNQVTPNPLYTFTGTETQPADFLSAYPGAFTAADAMNSLHLNDLDNSPTYLGFTVTGLTVGATAVPEPATYAALAGLGALGLALYRRHARR